MHGIFGEELGHQSGAGLTWVIDPIDGTRAFITGMVHWGVLIALFDGAAPVLGVMYQPFTDELFTGNERCRRDYRRGALVRAVESAIVRVGCRCGARIDVAASIRERGRTSGGFRCACARVRTDALGRRLLSVLHARDGLRRRRGEAGLKPYDVQALMPIIRGAGGIVTTWDGGDASMGGRVIASGDARVHREAMAMLNNGMAGKLD